MSDLSDWAAVAEAIEDMPRGTQLRLARALSMDPSYLARKLAKGGPINVDQAARVGEFLRGDKSGLIIPSPGLRVPVMGYAAASSGDRIALNTGDAIDWIELPAGLAPPGEVFVVRSLGSSMEPRIFDGEYLVVRKGVPPARDRDAIIEFTDGSGVVKTYKGQRQGVVFAEQYNPSEELRYPQASVKQITAVYCRL